MNYLNENDPVSAEWLRRLIASGAIPPSIVDERSIEDVKPSELAGFAQCHFFAGIGGWPLALSLAGLPSDWPVWTGSCPCQPFSTAGQGAGFADKRHLWPSWHWLIEQRRPVRVFGEQVDSPAGRHWFDLVSTDMDGFGYRIGSAVFPAAGVGAPQARHRRYFVADADFLGGRRRSADGIHDHRAPWRDLVRRRRSGRVAGASGGGREWVEDGEGREHDGRAAGRQQGQREPQSSGAGGALARAGSIGRNLRSEDGENGGQGRDAAARLHPPFGTGDGRGPVAGFWRNADWLGCRDGKWRPVEPGSFPLVDGVSDRVAQLRGYGNAIVPHAAQAFIEAYLDCLIDEEMGV